MSDDEIILKKVEKAIEIVCPLYKSNLITDAYVIGSVAKGTARIESDIDIVIINPLFEVNLEDLTPSEELENIKRIVDKLKDIGVEFKLISKEKEVIYKFWYQLYKGDLFHIMPQKYIIDSLPKIELTRDLCD